MFKKVTVLILLTVFASGFLVAEGQQDSSKSVLINIASTFPPEGPMHEGLEKFKEIIESDSSNKMNVIIHPSGALGGEAELIESLRAGSVEMGAQGIMDLVMYMPEYTVFEEPYVIRDIDHLRTFWSTIGKEIHQKLDDEYGIMTPAVSVRGARMVTSNKPVTRPEDLEGLRFRLPAYPVRIKVFEEFGAVPTVVAFPEVYMALRTGTVDSQENPPETIFNYKYFEAQDYLIKTNHVWSTGRFQISRRWFDTLESTQQETILNAWEEVEAYLAEKYPDPDAVFVEMLESAGMTVIEPEIELFMNAAEPVLMHFDEELWAPGLRQRIKEL
ncbi:MAG: TRAP transporter substrate-binding protein [Spirochaetales bacterium]|nr:TRAP transporter substrate-binding protein [Spirochaetales bacterium]